MATTARRTPAAGDNASSHEERAHDLTMHVFSISAAMVGVCLTAIGILRLDRLRLVVDSLFMLALALTVVICGTIAWALV